MLRFVALLVTLALYAPQAVGILGRGVPQGASAPPPAFTATWVVDSTGPITMGLVASEGEIPAGSGVQVGSFTTQTDVQNTWGDGSLRHAFVSFDAASTGSKALTVISNPGGSHTPTWPSASVVFAVSAGAGAGNTYTAALPSFTGTNCSANGAVARRCWVLVVPTTAGAVAHPSISVIYEVTSYAAGGHKVGIAIQNIKRSTSTDLVTGDITTTVNGSGVASLTQSAWTFYTGTRWYRTTTVSMTEAVVKHDFEPWIRANVVPRIGASPDAETYNTTCDSFQTLGGGAMWDAGHAACDFVPGFGIVGVNQGNSESVGRDELPPFADWDARYMATGDNTYRLVSLMNANQSGGWTNAIDKNGDGQSILRLDQDSNYANVWTTSAAWVGLGWQTDVTCGWKGVNNGGCGQFWPSANTVVEREHLPESNFIPYLMTGEKFYLDQLRFQASWTAFISYPGYDQVDPLIWTGFYRGRNGVQGELDDTETGRAFGRPLRMISRAAWAMPDSYSADKAYFLDVVQNNLEAITYYMDYLDSRGWDDTPYLGVGMNPTGRTSNTWQIRRGNSVTATVNSGGGVTTLTVIGDDSGMGTGINDTGMQTGDYVDLSGFVTSGATALNGQHIQVTRLSATSFSVPVTTSANTTNEGDWITITAPYVGQFRLAITAWETGWICSSGLWTCTSTQWSFTEKIAMLCTMLQSNPTFSTAPGVSYNFYVATGHVVGDDYSLYTSWTDYQGANNYGAATGALFSSEATYSSGGVSIHRGYDGWNPAQPNAFYTVYFVPVLLYAQERGVSGAATALTNLRAAQDVLPALKERPGFYWADR